MDPNAIAGTIEEDVRADRLPAGTVLRQEELAERFAVSRQPVRLAIEILRASGIVIPRSDRSVEVAGVSARALGELLAVRLLVEREALALAIPRLGERDLLAARHLQERIEIEADPKALVELDSAFHATLYSPGGNARLLRLIADLRREDLRPYGEQAPGSANRRTLTRQHRALLRACQAGDVAGALAALEAHLGKLMRN